MAPLEEYIEQVVAENGDSKYSYDRSRVKAAKTLMKSSFYRSSEKGAIRLHRLAHLAFSLKLANDAMIVISLRHSEVISTKRADHLRAENEVYKRVAREGRLR